jgi:hypothetical protein
MWSASLLMAMAWPMMLAGQSPTLPAGTVSLAGMRDRVRPLLIFAPAPDDPRLELQLRGLHEAQAALVERDVVVVVVPFKSPSTSGAMLTGKMLSDADAQAARRRFKIAPGEFVVILVGKDGGEKLRSSEPLAVTTLRETIDAMPMRQEEMRSKRPPRD